MADSKLMAGYLLYQAKEHNIKMNVTKVHKLLYALDGMLLANDVNAIEENCRAWKYGPVYPRVHTMLQEFDIDSLAEYNKKFDTLEEEIPLLKETIIDMLGQIGGRSAVDLSNWSHEADSPWDKTMRENDRQQGAIIKKDLIKEYFLTLKD